MNMTLSEALKISMPLAFALNAVLRFHGSRQQGGWGGHFILLHRVKLEKNIFHRLMGKIPIGFFPKYNGNSEN